MGRAPCCEKIGLKRGPWTPEEDQKLVAYINENGHGSWRALPKKAGLLRCGKSCRLRWTNYLRPDIKRGEFSLAEEQTIIQLHALLGNRWSAIASHLPKRTDNEIKNYWNTHLKKKLVKMGLDPTTHKPTVDNTLMSSNADPGTNIETGTAGLLLKTAHSSNGSSVTSHMAQWESARLEAERRLAQESQLRAKGLWRPGSVAPNPIHVAPLSTLAPCSMPFNAITNSAACADALKALNAVELMHALHNWEKSLQGQAGMMWPESWRLPGVHFPLREVQAESSSCSSHCSDANTNNNTTTTNTDTNCNSNANTNTNTSPLVTAGPRRLDHWSPTSTLCSLDSHSIKQKGLQSSLVSCTHSGAHVRKLSWSDALAPPPPKLEMPVSLPLSNVSSGFGMQGVSCKIEEDSSTFSSLMQDAVFGTDTTVSMYVSSLEEDASASKKDAVGGTDGKMREAFGGVSSGAADEGTYAKMFVTYLNNVVDEGTCGKLGLTAKREGNVMVVDGTCGATYEDATYQGVSIGKDSDKESCSEALAHDTCSTKRDGVENVSGVVLSDMDLVERDRKEGVADRTNANSDDNSKNGDELLSEMDLEGDKKEAVVDHNNADSDGNIKNDDVDDSDEGKSMCIGVEMVSAEVFKDLPKLKSKASTPHLTSYCALLSEEIPDYWSSIMLKEPNLQQVDMTF